MHEHELIGNIILIDDIGIIILNCVVPDAETIMLMYI
jgi:hypothetical protein